MRLLMKKTVDGARDGMKTEKFHEGQSYDFSDAPREAELAGVFVREGWAAEVAAAPATAAAPPADDRPVYRLPLLEEYVAAGRKAETYENFLKMEGEEAVKEGYRVEIRAMNEKELAEKTAREAADRAEFAAREAEIEKQRKAREEEKAATAASQPPQDLPADAKPEEKPTEQPAEQPKTEAAPPPAPTKPDAPAAKSKGHGKSKEK